MVFQCNLEFKYNTTAVVSTKLVFHGLGFYHNTVWPTMISQYQKGVFHGKSHDFMIWVGQRFCDFFSIRLIKYDYVVREGQTCMTSFMDNPLPDKMIRPISFEQANPILSSSGCKQPRRMSDPWPSPRSIAPFRRRILESSLIQFGHL